MLTTVFLFALPLTGAGDCPPLLFSNQPVAQRASRDDSEVTFQLEPGRLQPQLEQLLIRHFDVQSVVWLASKHHSWPSRYRAQARSWDRLLEELIAPYLLRVRLHANHTAVVDYLPQLKGAL